MHQGEQANINIIVAWAESALVQVSLSILSSRVGVVFCLLSFYHAVSFSLLLYSDFLPQVAKMINVSSETEIREGIAELQAAQVQISSQLASNIFIINYFCKIFLKIIFANYFVKN